MTSPWWYRGRTWVFAAIYFVGFFVGGFISRTLHGSYVPAFRELGAFLGPGGPLALLAFAVICAGICFAVRVWGSSYLRAGIVWNPEARSDRLVIAGPFRYVRNPLYFGNFLLSLGVGLVAPVAGLVLILAGNVAFVIALARHEEVILESTYGQRFHMYAAQVPSLIPRFVPVPQQGNIWPSLRQGLLAEVFTGALFAGMLLFVADRQHGEIDFFILYLAGIIAQRFIVRAQQQQQQQRT